MSLKIVCTAALVLASSTFAEQPVTSDDVDLESFAGYLLHNSREVARTGDRDKAAAMERNEARLIGVSVDDPAAALKPFGQQYKVNYPLLVGDGRDDIKGPKAYNASWGLPKTFVIGRDGRICKTHVGLSSKEHFEQQIKSLL